MPYIWIGFAVVMAVCEAATAQLVSVWFVIGAICAAIATIFTGSLIIQSLIFFFWSDKSETYSLILRTPSQSDRLR